jgi:ribonucleoside-diphosphate reductase alpha chain
MAINMSPIALEVLEKRYLKRDLQGSVAETPEEMFARVACHVSESEKRYGGDPEECCRKFCSAMRDLRFLPNSPTLMNAGLPLGQLSACFVLPIEDSLEGIFDALKYMALIHQSGGGTGFSFSRLRPRNDVVAATGGVASGPVSFMKIFDAATSVVKQGGRRRGANMGVLRSDHPDILEFIRAKEKPGCLENFNLSVSATDRFMSLARSGGDLQLINPRTGEPTDSIDAKRLLYAVAKSAWRGGDPGVLFIDRINKLSTVPGIIEATNPCGEQPLLPYESCNLGSVNLSRIVERGEIAWDTLGELVSLGVRFLDNCIDINKFPLKTIEEATLRTRKIGLGVMGFAEMLIQMNISYGSRDAVKAAEEIMSYISARAKEASAQLGEERGPFPLFEKSSLKAWGMARNANTTTIAPTGTISMIAGTSSGIEPLFAVAFSRQVMGREILEVSPLFKRMAKDEGICSQDLIGEIARRGSIQDMALVPEDLKEIFVTALEIPAEQHLAVQAAFQRHTDGAVSKTVNLPGSASIEDVQNVFLMAYEMGCKGVTAYRYGSRDQVLNIGEAQGCQSCTEC